MKKVFGKIHLWLGFTSGLLVFIIAVTGCLYAFQVEIQDALQPYRFVQQQDRPLLPPSRLKAIAQELLPGKHIHAVLYPGKGRAAQVIFFAFEPEYYDIVYIDPYTANVLKVKNMEEDFFHLVLEGHFYLWLPPQIGQPVVATSTLIFVIMLVTGMVLWWPRKKKDLKQRFRVKWNAKWRRRNYDLHNVLGFYAFSIALVLALTGLVFGFQWFAKAVYKAAGGDKTLIYSDPTSSSTVALRPDNGIDSAFTIMLREYPNAETIEVHIPFDNTTAVAANANPDASTYWKLDYRYFDQRSLKEINVDHVYSRFPEAKFADKLMRMNYDIHTGAILGLPGKVLAFFVSLICASLPVTGVRIWWGRRNKKSSAPKTTADNADVAFSS